MQEHESQVKITPKIQQQVEQLLGRTPRGLEEVSVCSASGLPMVIRVASLVEGKPFPNLFWLIDAALVYKIDVVEAGGLIAEFQAQVEGDEGLKNGMLSDHQAHIALRNAHMSESVETQLRSSNYYDVLQSRGIGGIADFGRIRCLHTWYAAHLVVPNTIGNMLDRYWVSIDTLGDL
jgi:hypothetical protein